MKYAPCVLIAVLVALLMPCQSYGDELPTETTDGAFAQKVKLAHKVKTATGHGSICIDHRARNYLTLDEYAETGLCLFMGRSIEEMAGEFERVQAEIRRAKRLAALNRCARHVAEIYADGGQSNGPPAAPSRVKQVICAANEIDALPYIWGGGHDSFESSGYDCSGAVSFALHGGGFLSSPLVSSELESWGEPGPGHWITVYANSGHAWMTVAGVRFDTREPPTGETGPRWHSTESSPAGFAVRHPAGF